MIKINLVKSRITEGTGASQANIDFDATTSSARTEGLIKLILMSGFVVGAVLYRGNQIDELSAKAAQLQQQLSEAQTVLNQKIEEAASKGALESEARELENKLSIIRDLSGLRLVEVKALDFIQSVVPEKLWLNSISYSNSKFSILGTSISDEEINEFINALEESPYFTEVILLQSIEKAGSEGSTKSFELSFIAGNEN